MPELEERFADALHGTARIWRQAIDRRLKNLGMSQASWMTIAVASKARSPLSQSELAERLGVEGATMVAMVDRLAKAGFVVRQPCQTDRRINRVVLTAEGNRLFDAVKTEAAAVRKELLATIDPAKLAIATELLETLQGLIERYE
ncbi:MAG: MarR family transcriptional regulator [Steroidobacteraceae bacterium]|jgi:MarR family transcriptional regulator for hemolysin